MSELNQYPFLLRSLLSMWMKSVGIEIFMTRTVHELLWGFKDPLLSRLRAIKPEVDETFGLMWKVSIGGASLSLLLLLLSVVFFEDNQGFSL